MIDFNGETSVYGITGDPVHHSLSPLFQNYFLQQHHYNAVYLPFHVEPENLATALSGLHAANIQGLNITVPHKESTLALVKADSDALTIGAVNTLKRAHSGWKATNTDWQGFAAVLQGLNTDVSKAPVLLFGAGGTSRAVCHALSHQGVKELWICNRTTERVTNLIKDLQGSYPNIQFKTVIWSNEEVLKHSNLCQVIINTSSIGLSNSDTFPFLLNGRGVAIDAVYKPNGKTAFSDAATKGGFTAVDGLPMLIAQGIASFNFWHHEQLPSPSFALPDKLQSLQWVEKKLARQPLHLTGWRT